MMDDGIKTKLQDIINGTCQKGGTDSCATTRNYLIESFGTGPTVKREFESKSIIKKEESLLIRSYAKKMGLLLDSLPQGIEFFAKGGESNVYLNRDGRNVTKINGAVYYATWTEYFTSLSMHNLLFSNTKYSLLGFMENEGVLNAVLQQSYIMGEQAN
jgi:hypothetical protein